MNNQHQHRLPCPPAEGAEKKRKRNNSNNHKKKNKWTIFDVPASNSRKVAVAVERGKDSIWEKLHASAKHREKRAATFAYLQEVAFPIIRRVWSLSPQTLCQLEPQIFFFFLHILQIHMEREKVLNFYYLWTLISTS